MSFFIAQRAQDQDLSQREFIEITQKQVFPIPVCGLHLPYQVKLRPPISLVTVKTLKKT
jgi:hypothetical protein